MCKELENAGMITAALWTDFDQDNQVDLIVTGEWMPVLFFRNNNGIFKNVTRQTGLPPTEGWWNSLTAGDFDNDGDLDYVAGNLGLNSRYKASAEQPVTLVAKDFDKSGNIDPVMGYYIQGKNYPAPPRDALTDQMVTMRKRFPRYSDYGEATFDKLFTPEKLKDARQLKSHRFTSSYIQNQSQGKFKIKALSTVAQVAPVFGMVTTDFNHDGNLDLLLVGNSYATETAVGYYDASVGTCLAGTGKGTFRSIAPKVSGFTVAGDTKALAQLLTTGNKPLYLVTQNADSLKVFTSTSNQNYQIIPLQPTDAYAELHFTNGKKHREEFYYGSGYLSQSSRTLISQNLATVYITDFTGKQRQIELGSKAVALQRTR
ncbi:hypothetical protein AHMF7605_25295 [Adhaeribacter arboris]|uniref:VCBS repeat-containing protein n=1 Tax=Adhaeribacter arboris TaxID=2072846 RepID=A0A2T2YM41_9BACT|nr:hypothetical protein AHMF7605_25295 [Adhaeribacter arboris]